jgi:hypothetical protein
MWNYNVIRHGLSYKRSKTMGKEDEIRLIAYKIWEDGGYKNGLDWEYWFKAESVWEKQNEPVQEPVGKVSDFFAHPSVAGITLTGPVKIGDKIKIKGHTTDFETTIDSLQIHNAPVREAKADDEIGIKVPERVRIGDIVYKISE